MNAPPHHIDTEGNPSREGNDSGHAPVRGTKLLPTERFLDWCNKHQLLTVGRQLLASVPTARDQYLLGGTLGFLTHRQTQSVLNQWAQASTDMSVMALVRMSEVLNLDFPDIRVPTPGQPISALFHGQGLITRCYLAACICTRRPPGSSETQKEAFASLKLWLLLKSFGFASTGAVHDQSIRSVADHLRMALDGSFPEKLQRFDALLDPSYSTSQFEHQLKARLTTFAHGGEAWQKDVMRSIQRLIALERTPINELDSQNESAWPTAQLEQFNQEARSGDVVGEITEATEPAPEDNFGVSGVNESVDQNPVQRVRLSQAIALQGLEDRQYLPWSWNRLRADEKQILDC